jgi:hypothetical protein
MTTAPPLSSQAPPQTSGLAIGSMICGILGFLTAGLTGLPAVILGHIGLSQIKKSGGALGGGGFAITGLITGYITVLILPIAVVAGLLAPLILRTQVKADQVEMISNMKMVGLSLLEFDQEFGGFPSDETARLVAEATSSEDLKMTGSSVLRQLEVFGCTDSMDELLAVGSGAEGDWTYFPGHTMEHHYETVILISPTIRNEAMALRIDNSVETLPEYEAASLRAAPDAVTIPAIKR